MTCFVRARRACFLALLFTTTSAGMLIWAGVGLLAVGMEEPAYVSFVLAAAALWACSIISPRTKLQKIIEQSQGVR